MNTTHIMLNLLFLLTKRRPALICIYCCRLLIVVVVHTHSRAWLSVCLLHSGLNVGLLIPQELIGVFCGLTCTTYPLVLWFFRDIVVGLVKVVRSRYIICTILNDASSCKTVRVLSPSNLARVLLYCNTFWSLWTMSRMSQGLPLFDLLINDGKISLKVLGILLVKGGHSKLLVN